MSYIPFQKPPSISDAKRLYTSAKDDMPEEDVTEWVNSLIREEDEVGDDLPHPLPPEPRLKLPIMKAILVQLLPYIVLGLATIPVSMILYEWLFSSFSWEITFTIISTCLGAFTVVFCFALAWIFIAMANAVLKKIFPEPRVHGHSKMAEQKRKWYDLDPTVLAIIATIAIVLASICLWRGFFNV
jgi:hypothetical protein